MDEFWRHISHRAVVTLTIDLEHLRCGIPPLPNLRVTTLRIGERAVEKRTSVIVLMDESEESLALGPFISLETLHVSCADVHYCRENDCWLSIDSLVLLVRALNQDRKLPRLTLESVGLEGDRDKILGLVELLVEDSFFGLNGSDGSESENESS